jgi:hypothetical protein
MIVVGSAWDESITNLNLVGFFARSMQKRISIDIPERGIAWFLCIKASIKHPSNNFFEQLTRIQWFEVV